MVRVLFVCLGNICRSPMAEAVFADLVRRAGLDDKIEVDSAGTGHWHLGERAHPGTRRVLERNRITYDGRSRLITRHDLDQFDYVITMDDANLCSVQAIGAGRAAVHPLMDFAPHLDVTEVPDPYYDGRFERVYELVLEAAEGLLTTIRREHDI